MPRRVPSPALRLDFLGPPPPSSSVRPASWPPEREAFYGEVLDVLAEADVGFLLGGALALNVHTGIWRDTKDLDVFLPPQNVDAALGAAEAAGLSTETVYPEWLSRVYRGDAFVDLIHHGANALVGVTDAWFERATPARVLGRDVLVLGVEDLVWSKMYVVARNRCDAADIHHVLYRAGRALRWDVLLENVGDDAGLLLAHLHLFRWAYPEATDRVPEDVLAELERRARRPARGFRGTLLDVVTYRVDVDAWGLQDAQADARERVLRGL